jgi:hypothetical protein
MLIHAVAFRSITPELQKYFSFLMECVRDDMRCEECKTHITEYLKNHPIEYWHNYVNLEGRLVGCFIWSVNFHNAVNTRLGKLTIPYTEAYKMFNTLTVCKTDCDSH